MWSFDDLCSAARIGFEISRGVSVMREAKCRVLSKTVLVDFDDELIEFVVTAKVYPPVPDSLDGPGTDWWIDVINVASDAGSPVSDDDWNAADRAARDDIALWVDAYTAADDRDASYAADMRREEREDAP